jgi:nucleoside-diphosphate kinase
LRFAGAKIVHVNKMLADQHYAEHRGKVFFPALIDYLMGLAHYPNEPWKRRVIAFVFQGHGAIAKIREIAGPTDPNEARDKKPGCIRALGTIVQLRNTEGKVIGERMDNLIHASANNTEAEREIKLWFRPSDIPPLMHAYPTEINEEHYYFRGKTLSLAHERGSICLLAPGDCVWKSDLNALRSIYQGKSSHSDIETVAAKYLINERRDNV